MPRKGSKQPYKPKKEYTYTIQGIAELAGTTKNTLGTAKVRGKIDPEDFKSVGNFLIKMIIKKRLSKDLFASTEKAGRRVKKTKSGLSVLGKRTRKATSR